MGKCCICGTNISSEVEYIYIGLVRKKMLPVCDKCGEKLKIINTADLTTEEYCAANSYFKKNIPNMQNAGIKRYIELCKKSRLKRQNKKRKYHGTIYFVDKVPLKKIGYRDYTIVANVPECCTYCINKTENTELVSRFYNPKGYFGSGRGRVYRVSLKFPICKKCFCLRTRVSVRITAFTDRFASCGIIFSNGEYAKKFAEVNEKRCYQFEDYGFPEMPLGIIWRSFLRVAVILVFFLLLKLF